MRTLYARQADFEIELYDSESHMIAGFEDEAARKTSRAVNDGDAEPHACDDCGQVKADVDLWAENHDTGDELWLCMACGEW